MTLLEAIAGTLADFAGTRVLPLGPVGGDPKHPLTTGGCRSAAASEAGVELLFRSHPQATGYAVYPAPDIVVIDVDVKNGKDGIADIAHLADTLGPLPTTAEVTTPSGGKHLYFSLPAGADVPHSIIGKVGRVIRKDNGSLLPTGLDIFAHHPERSMWVAGPGTVTPKGTYTWANDDEVAELPATWIEHLQNAKKKPERDPAALRSNTRSRCHEEFVREALAAIPPTDLGHANRFTVRAVVLESEVMREDGTAMPDEEKIELLRDWCAINPKFDEKAFARSIDSIERGIGDDNINRVTVGSLVHLAREHGYNVPARIDPRAMFRKVEREISPGLKVTQHGRFSVLDPDQDDLTPEPEWLIPDLLLKGSHAVLAAAPGSLKTFVALDIALSIAVGSAPGNGRMWPEITDPGPVLFAAGEGGHGLKMRRAAWEKQHNGGRKVPNFFRSTGVPLIQNREDIEAFISAASERSPEYRLVVIDTVSRAMQGKNENAQEFASAFTQLVQEIQTRLGAAVLAIGHGDKAGSRTLRGSGAFAGDCDMLLFADRRDKAMLVDITMEKQKEAPEVHPGAMGAIEVDLPNDKTSLVIVRPDPSQQRPAEQTAERASKKDMFKPTGSKVETGYEDFKTAVEKVLRATTARINGKQLCEQASHHLKAGVTFKTLQNHYLPRLIADGHPGYDAQGTQTRWRNWV